MEEPLCNAYHSIKKVMAEMPRNKGTTKHSRKHHPTKKSRYSWRKALTKLKRKLQGKKQSLCKQRD
jgi:transcription initiation factor IIE alpha subunit